MKIFVSLVDSNAQIASYKRALGLTLDNVRQHMQHIKFYREITGLSIQIRKLLKNKKDNIQQIEKLRVRLRLTIEEWKNG